MARAGIVYSQVADAAARLAAAGKNPTVDGVRAALGGTGSKSTIAPLLKRWKTAHQEALAETESGLPGELLQALKGVYETLQAGLQQQLEQAQREQEVALQAAAEQTRQAQAEQRAQAEANAALSGQLAQTQQALAQLQAEQHASNVALATLHSDNAGLQQRLADRAAEVAAVNQQLSHARRQFEHYQEASAAQRTQERQAAEQRIAQIERDLGGAQQRLQASLATVAQQETHLLHLRADHERLQQSAGAAQDALALLRPQRDQLTYQCDELSAANRLLLEQLEAARHTLTEARMGLAAQQRQTELMAAQLAQADGKRQELEREQLTLIQQNTLLQLQTIIAKPAKPGSDHD